jgi:hypothetical protein
MLTRRCFMLTRRCFMLTRLLPYADAPLLYADAPLPYADAPLPYITFISYHCYYVHICPTSCPHLAYVNTYAYDCV